MKRVILLLLAIILVTLACGMRAIGTNPQGTPGAIPTLKTSAFDLGRTVYGFFPSPPEATTQSVIDTYKAIGQNGDVVLLQQSIPWEMFATSTDHQHVVRIRIRSSDHHAL